MGWVERTAWSQEREGRNSVIVLLSQIIKTFLELENWHNG